MSDTVSTSTTLSNTPLGSPPAVPWWIAELEKLPSIDDEEEDFDNQPSYFFTPTPTPSFGHERDNHHHISSSSGSCKSSNDTYYSSDADEDDHHDEEGYYYIGGSQKGREYDIYYASGSLEALYAVIKRSHPHVLAPVEEEDEEVYERMELEDLREDIQVESAAYYYELDFFSEGDCIAIEEATPRALKGLGISLESIADYSDAYDDSESEYDLGHLYDVPYADSVASKALNDLGILSLRLNSDESEDSSESDPEDLWGSPTPVVV